MKFFFASAWPLLPEQVGGAGRSADALLTLLVQRGHGCEAVAALRRGGRRRVVRALRFLTQRRCLGWSDSRNGYPTYRTIAKEVPELVAQRLAKFKPDVVITQLPKSHRIAEIALNGGVRVAFMVHDAEFDRMTWPPRDSRVKFISASEFIARRLRQKLGLDSAVIYPIVPIADFRVVNRVPKFITFINPVAEKGVDLILQVASLLPHHPFLVVEGWHLDSRSLGAICNRLASRSNIEFMRWTRDMRTVYRQTSVLLMPSRWEEAFGRVAIEAQVSGIPILAHDIGGLGEALRDSGILFSPDAPAQTWADEIERLLSDRSLYEAQSAAAAANAARPEFDPDRQIERFLALVSNW